MTVESLNLQVGDLVKTGEYGYENTPGLVIRVRRFFAQYEVLWATNTKTQLFLRSELTLISKAALAS